MTKTAMVGVFIALLWIAAIPLIFLRLFGVLFFVQSTSILAVVPAIVLSVLLLLPQAARRPRQWGALALLAAYLCSVYLDGWNNLRYRLANGGTFPFEVLEATLIFVLVVLCLRAYPDDKQ
jgi:hypothetical protein